MKIKMTLNNLTIETRAVIVEAYDFVIARRVNWYTARGWQHTNTLEFEPYRHYVRLVFERRSYSTKEDAQPTAPVES
jgi:hypothetical protein